MTRALFLARNPHLRRKDLLCHCGCDCAPTGGDNCPGCDIAQPKENHGRECEADCRCRACRAASLTHNR